MENSIQDQTIATLVVGFQAMFSFAPRLCKIFGCKSIKEFWQCMTRPWTVLFSAQSATVMFIIELSSTLVSLLLLIPIWQLSPRSGSTYNIVSIVLSLCRCIVESVRQLKVSFQNLILPRYSRYVPAAALVFGLVFVPSGAILWKYEAIYATPVITTSSSASLCACTFGFFIVWGERVPGNAKDQMAKQLLLMGITLLAASLSAILSWIYRYEHQSYWLLLPISVSLGIWNSVFGWHGIFCSLCSKFRPKNKQTQKICHKDATGATGQRAHDLVPIVTGDSDVYILEGHSG